MNKIETLIDKLCPGGVKEVKLNEIFSYFNGMAGVSQKWKEHGNCKFIDFKNAFKNIKIDVSKLEKATVKNFKQNTLKKGDILLTSASETRDECAMSSVIEDQISENVFLDDHLFGLRLKDEFKDQINTTFINYYLRSDYSRKQVNNVVRGATRFYISKVDFMDLKIIIPPRAIQDEIVKILDNFTELTTELKDRIKQYEYYRDKLLSFDDSKVKVEYKPLKELCSITTGKLNAKDAVDGGIYPFFTCHAKPYSINEYAFDTEAILLSGNGNIGHTNYYNGKFNAYQRTYVLHNFIEVNPKFLLHYINNSFKDYISQKSLNGVISYITLPILQEFSVPIPPLPVQDRIAEVLDNFEKICKDLKIGLPSEIQLRQKQYEYYRNLLLSFNIDDIMRERERERR
ncbi:restriction endonuclease subunit S [Mycoplasmopsis bovirhinis]|uniref:Type I restriction enzyme specificity protein n=1 Tax=Mycoplasmopsis bovirhinis TaxID=29553 RepID=A0A449AD22_9BACT|nr:restriction endonuclease subunit S [Mycoplasmopsis bovirhinis]VEU62873.1 Type I restriction enzyme specificity protein [Mycoplasmopsis bovirhinis]